MNRVKKYPHLEGAFETVLFQCRFLALFAVVGSMLAAVTLYVKGSLEIAQGILGLVHAVTYFTPTSADDKLVILSFIPAIDNYLFATVLLIFSMGVYELFISEIDPAVRNAFSRPHWLVIDNLDDLKTQISEVVVMILIINFFQLSYTAAMSTPLDLIYLAAGILFISVSLFVAHKTMAQRTTRSLRKPQSSA